MRPPPSIVKFHQFPVTAGTALLAIGVGLAYWCGWQIDPLLEDYHILEGQYWRFLSSALPHANLLHLAFDVYWVWVFGTLMEQVFGHLRTLLLFLLLAATSGAAEFAILHGGIGLSGVGYGLFGFLWALSRRDPRFRNAIDQQTIWLFVFWFFLCIFLTATNIMPIANIAHGMGAVIGGVTGLIVVQRRTARAWLAALLVLLCAATGFAATVARPYVNLSNEGSMDYFNYGTQFLEKHRFPDAEAQLKHAITIDRRNASAWYNLGYCYEHQGRIADALIAYRHASQIDPLNDQYKDALNALTLLQAATQGDQ